MIASIFLPIVALLCNVSDSISDPTDTSVLILKKFNPIAQTEIFNGQFTALNNREFIKIQNPYKLLADTSYTTGFSSEMDTIYIKHTNATMLVEVNYSPFINTTYLVRAGDSLLIDYSKSAYEITETFINPNAFKYDIEKTSVIDSSDYIELLGLDFLIKDFRSKGLLEKQKYVLKAKDKMLDSVVAVGAIDPRFYEIRKSQIYFDLINTEDALKESEYIGLEEYKQYLIRKSDRMFSHAVKKKLDKGSSLYFTELFEFILNNPSFSANSKSFLLYYSLQNISDNIAFIDKFTIFKNQKGNSELSDYLRLKYPEKWMNKLDNSTLVYDYHNQTATLQDILNKHSGKVIYIDFLASWCGPCMSALPYSKKLKSEHTDVVFVYLALNDKDIPWRKMIERQSIYENSYFVTNSRSSKFVFQHKINTIPRYMIFNKKGKLVNSNAPSPSSPEIKQQLAKYLKE